MDRFLTARSPQKNSSLATALSSPGPLGALGDLLNISGDTVLVPQSPKKLSPQKRSPRRLVEFSDSERNMEAQWQAIQEARLTKRCVVETNYLRDDFYSTLLAPHPTAPLVAVGIRSMVQFWSCQNGGSAAEIPLEFGTILCMAYANSHLLVVGYSGGALLIYDQSVESVMHMLEIEQGSYPTCLEIKSDHVFVGTSSGSLVIVKILVAHRVRLQVIYEHRKVAADIICGLKAKKNTLLLGSNDGVVSIWDISDSENCFKLGQVQHRAAVKAMEFFKSQLFFITGGGRADRCLRVWNLHTFELHHEIGLPAQVTALFWVGKNELFVALGHARGKEQSLGQIWKFENGASALLTTVNGDKERCRAVYAVNSIDGIVVGTNTKKLYYYYWKQGTVAGTGLAKNPLTPIR